MNVNKVLIMMLFMLSCTVMANENKLTAFELNKHLLAFSDNYQESIAETIDNIIAEGVNSTARMMYHTVKLFYANSAISIAVEADATHQLLDMIVMLRLQRLVWQNGGDKALSTKDQAMRISLVLAKLESQLHKLALRVFTQTDVNSVVVLAEEWRQDNPERDYVAFVRFQNFADSEGKAKIDKILSKGGLFSSISDVTYEIEETRFAIERAMFMANRMPILIEWQAELFLYKTLSADEITQALTQSQRLTESAERISTQVEKLPEDIQTLFDKNSKFAVAITNNIAKTSENLKFISDQLSPLILSQDNYEHEEIDLKLVKLIFEDALATSNQLASIAESLNKFNYDSEVANNLSGLVAKQLTQVDNILAKRMADLDSRLFNHHELIFDRMFILLMAFCIVFPVVFFTGYLLARRHIIKYGKKITEETTQ